MHPKSAPRVAIPIVGTIGTDGTDRETTAKLDAKLDAALLPLLSDATAPDAVFYATPPVPMERLRVYRFHDAEWGRDFAWDVQVCERARQRVAFRPHRDADGLVDGVELHVVQLWALAEERAVYRPHEDTGSFLASERETPNAREYHSK